MISDLDNIVERLLRQELVLFLGDGIKGLERSPELPLNNRELSEYLAAKFNYPRDESRELERVAQYVSEIAGQDPLYDELHRIYAPAFPPNPLHSFLAGLPARLRERGIETRYQLILTMNYDDSLERAFQANNEPYDLLTYKRVDTRGSFIYFPHGAEPIKIRAGSRFSYSDFTRTIIFKLLGGVNRVDPSLDSFVITEEDYFDYLTDLRLLPAPILEKLIDGTMLYLGCNTRAQALRVVLNRVIERQPTRRRASWAVQQAPQPIDRSFWERRDVRLLDSSLTEFLNTLNSHIETRLPPPTEPPAPNERETVRSAPAEYVGSTDQAGLHRLIETVVENSLDHVAAGYCDAIDVVIHDDNSLAVTDNGVGFPVERTDTDGKTPAELAMTRLSVLENLFPKSQQALEEVHQISLALVNFLSESLHLEIWRDGKVYAQDYIRGEPQSSLSQVGKTRRRGKSITFKPDPNIFGTSEISFDQLSEYLREQSQLFSGLRITIKDERGEPETTHEFYYKTSRYFDALSSSNYDDRFNAIRSLTELGAGPLISKLFLETLAGNEKRQDQSGRQYPTAAEARQVIGETLGRIGREELSNIFVRLTTDETPKVAEAARAALVQLGVTGTTNPAMRNAYALIIAIDDYDHPALRLKYTVRDAQRLAEVLVDPKGCGYPPENVKLLLNKQATAKAIRASVNALIDRSIFDEDATIVLYFGGHGSRDGTDSGTLNLIPADFSESNQATYISATELADYLSRSVSSQNLLILDCSYSGLFHTVPQWALLASCRTDELAYEGEQGSFTTVLTTALLGHAGSNDGLIRIFDLYEYLQPQVTRISRDQHPVLYANFRNNFPIGLGLGGKPAPTTGPEEFRYDVYISFADEGDASVWVRKSLIPFLQRANLRVAISHDVNADETVSRVANAQRGITTARRTLMVLSPKYLQTKISEFESALSQTIGVEESSERLVAIDFSPIRSSELPHWISVQKLQWHDEPSSSTIFFEHLVEQLREPLHDSLVDFPARRSIMRRINDWLNVTSSRVCLVIGLAGNGKTTLVEWLVRLSEGRVGEDSYPELRQSIVVSASRRDGLTAVSVIESLARQLATRIPEFAEALVHSVSSFGGLEIETESQTLSGSSHGYTRVVIKSLDLSKLSSAAAFDAGLRWPLQELSGNENLTRPILIVIDGLDEFAVEQQSDVISFLEQNVDADLPITVRFLLTLRPNPLLVGRFRNALLLNLDEAIARHEQFSHLSPGAQKAFLWAEGLRRAQQAPQVYSEYLLAGLYRNPTGLTRRLLTLFEEESEVSADLESFANAMGSVKMSLSEVQPAPPEALDTLDLSTALEKVLAEAGALGTTKWQPPELHDYETTDEAELLGAFLREPTNQTGKFIANLVQAPQETLAQIVSERSSETFPLDRIWRASVRRPLFLNLYQHKTPVTALAFSLDGTLLYSGALDGTLCVWSAEDGRFIGSRSKLPPIGGSTRRYIHVRSIVALTDDHLLVGWQDGVIEILTTKLASVYRSISTDEITDADTRGLNAIAVTHQKVVIAHQEGNITIWGSEMEYFQGRLLLRSPVTDLAVTPDGRFAISVSIDKNLQVWNLESEKRLFTVRNEQNGGFHRVAILPDSEWAVAGCGDGKLEIFNIQTGSILFELPGQRQPIAAMVIVADGRQLITASKDGLRAWDLERREQIFSDRGFWEYTALAVAPDGRTLATGSNDKIVRLWDRATLFPFPAPAPAPRRYRIAVSPSIEVVSAGKDFTLQINLIATQAGTDAFELPRDVTSLACFITSEDCGLRLKGSEAANIRLDPSTDQFIPVSFELHAQWPGTRSYSILLFADSDAPQSRIYETSGQIRVKPHAAGEPRLPLEPAIDVRLAPQPDFVLQLDTELPEGANGPHLLTYRLSSRLPHLPLRNQEVGTASLPAGELSRLRTLLHSTLQPSGLQPEDTREQLLSFGSYLFDRLFPPDKTTALREAFWTAAEKLTTWLFVEDGVTWAPWELLVPYRRDVNEPRFFLGERFHVSRWLELGPSLYSEVPFGDLALAHYKSGEHDEELTAWGRLLDAVNAGGIAEIVKRDKPCYRLHLLRYTDEPGSARRALVPRDEKIAVASPTEDAKRARLDLRLNRPVISLSILDSNGARTELREDWPLPDRVLPFLRAGASAVIGPWWPTSEAADHIFWLNFYDLVETRVPLGEAVWRARRMVQQSLPNSPDWLAYTLFGDPRARAYKPAPSEGYTILERLYPDQPVHRGETCYFRASISNRPSLFYQERLVQADELPKNPMALFIAPGLQDNIPEPVEMKLVGGSTVEAIYKLTPEKTGEFALIARLYDGDERLQSLQLPFMVEQ